MKRLVPVMRRFAAERNLPGQQADTKIPFSTFIGFIESQRAGRRNHHWDTQQSVLFTNLIEYDRIYRMESEFVSGMTQILTQIGLPTEWVERNLAQPRNASGRVKESVYTPELADRVYRIYEPDFATFGYDRDSWRETVS